MVVSRSPILRFILAALIIALPVAAFAAPVGKVSGGGSSLQWQLSVSGHEKVVLSVSAPDGEVYSFDYPNGKAVVFNLKDLPSADNGSYTYQLTVVPKIPAGLQKQLEAARKAGNDAAARALLRSAGLSEPVTQTGGFLVLGGSIVSPDATEPDANNGANARMQESATLREGGPINRGGDSSTTARPGTPVVNDNVIPDDLIVQGSACVGLDCVNNESFGFDTIRLKENNTRIKFDDTSSSAGFPANDWQLTANDSASGGSSKFSIEDITGSKVPFTVTAGASTNSIFVDSTGRVGFRTSTPVLDLHVATSNTPAIRLEQNNSGGFTAQTWDIAGNEANFFVRDVTGGSRLPFRIRPGAPTSSIDISASGKVGIGTASPSNTLHVTQSDGTTKQLIKETSGTTTARELLELNNNGAPIMVFANSNDASVRWTIGMSGTTFIWDDQADGPVEMSLSTAGNLATTGTITPGSSRTIKQDFTPVDSREVLNKVASMPITSWAYIKDPGTRHIGPMAEDFYGSFAVGGDKGISVTDSAGVSLAAIQGLNQIVQEKEKEITDLKARLEKIEKMLAQQQH
jgi:hypothetical protein